VSQFEKLDERLVHQGAVVGFWEGRFRGPDGQEFTRDVVKHPGAVSIVPLLDDESVVMVRQFRAALDKLVLEIPAGKLDEVGEPPEDCARRELVEEVGYEAGQLVHLTSFAQSPGFCDEVNHVYLATDLSKTDASTQGIEEEHMTVEVVPLADIPAAIASGEIIDAKTIIGLLLTMRSRRSESQ
jgi:ADP-ribose pyrophosphatase